VAEPNFSLRPGRIMMACIMLGSLAMVAVIWWYYSTQQKAIEAATTRGITAIAEAKVGQIANWRRERLAPLPEPGVRTRRLNQDPDYCR